jgi:hypothetical protein
MQGASQKLVQVCVVIVYEKKEDERIIGKSLLADHHFSIT